MYKLIFFSILFVNGHSGQLIIKNLEKGPICLRAGHRRVFLTANQKVELEFLSDFFNDVEKIELNSGRVYILNNTGQKGQGKKIVVRQKVPSKEDIDFHISERDALVADAPLDIMNPYVSREIFIPYFEELEYEPPEIEKEEEATVIFSMRNYSNEPIKITTQKESFFLQEGEYKSFNPDSTVYIHTLTDTYEVPEQKLHVLLKEGNYKLNEMRIYFMNEHMKFVAKNNRNDWSEVLKISRKKDLILYRKNAILENFSETQSEKSLEK